MNLYLVLIVYLYAVCAESKIFPPLPPLDKVVPVNLCNYYADDSDMSKAGINNAIFNYCQDQLHTRPYAVHVNADDNPYKMCLAAGTAYFSSLEPVTGQSIVAKDFFNNTSDQVVTHQFSLSGSFSQNIAVATINTVAISKSVGYSIDIPPALRATFSVSTSFESSKTQTNSATSVLQYSPSTTTQCQPKCSYTAIETVQTSTYSSNFNVPLCLTGYARCEYKNPVNGHYLWFVVIDDFISPNDRCFTQAGTLSSLISNIDSQTTLSKSCF